MYRMLLHTLIVSILSYGPSFISHSQQRTEHKDLRDSYGRMIKCVNRSIVSRPHQTAFYWQVAMITGPSNFFLVIFSEKRVAWSGPNALIRTQMRHIQHRPTSTWIQTHRLIVLLAISSDSHWMARSGGVPHLFRLRGAFEKRRGDYRLQINVYGLQHMPSCRCSINCPFCGHPSGLSRSDEYTRTFVRGSRSLLLKIIVWEKKHPLTLEKQHERCTNVLIIYVLPHESVYTSHEIGTWETSSKNASPVKKIIPRLPWPRASIK